MNKIVLISDTHFGSRSFSKPVFNMQMDYFKKDFFPYILKHKIKDVIHLGDMVHNRNSIDLYLLHTLKTEFFQWFDDNEVNLYSLVGNHDSFYKNTIECNFQTSSMGNYKYIHPIAENKILRIGPHKIGFVPWVTDLDAMKLPRPVDVDLLAGHFEIVGALMQGKTLSKSGSPYELFKDYKKVVSGHYHAMSSRHNFTYLGAPYQNNWGDFSQGKGFWLLDDNLEMKYIKNKTSPKHIKLFYEENGQLKLSCSGFNSKTQNISLPEAIDICESNYVKFIVLKSKDQGLLSHTFETITENSYDRVDILDESGFIEEIDEDQLEQDIQKGLELSDIIINFLTTATFQDGIDPVIIKSMMEELIKSSKEKGIP